MTPPQLPARRGRPPKPPGEGKPARIEGRTTHERKAKLERMAARDGVSATEWLERAIDAARE